MDDETPTIKPLDVNYDNISSLYKKYKNLLINENIINNWIKGYEFSSTERDELVKILDDHITKKYNELINEYIEEKKESAEEITSNDILLYHKQLIINDIEELEKNKKVLIEDNIVLSLNYDDIKKETLLNELTIILEDLVYIDYKYILQQNLSESDKKSIGLTIRNNLIKTIEEKVTTIKIQIYENQDSELSDQISKNNIDTNIDNIIYITYLQHLIEEYKEKRDALYIKYNIEKEEESHITWSFKGYFMFLLQAIGIILWIFVAHLSYNIFIQSGYWWIFAFTFAILGGIGIIIHYLWIPFLGLLICGLRKMWIGTCWFGIGIGIILFSKFVQMCADGFGKNFAKDSGEINKDNAGFFWWLSHKYNDTLGFGFGMDWNTFWWKWYEQVPSWSQHAFCFFKCKYQNLTIPIYPESYKNFNFAFNHFMYKILTGLFGNTIFKNSVELNQNQLPELGRFG